MERADTGPSGPAKSYPSPARSRTMPLIMMFVLAALAALGFVFAWPWGP